MLCIWFRVDAFLYHSRFVTCMVSLLHPCPCNSVLHVLHHDHPHATSTRLCDHGGRSSALVPPGRRQDTDGLVVAGQAVDAGLDENEAAARCQYNFLLQAQCANVQLSVAVLAVGREVLADGHSLLDEHVKILWDLGGEAC
jgi:hypothetical protein